MLSWLARLLLLRILPRRLVPFLFLLDVLLVLRRLLAGRSPMPTPAERARGAGPTEADWMRRLGRRDAAAPVPTGDELPGEPMVIEGTATHADGDDVSGR
jgi:hypothetical protein